MSTLSSEPANHDPPSHADWDQLEQNEPHLPPSRLSSRQILAFPVLATSPNRRQAALEVGISERTHYRWPKNERFRYELNRLTTETAELTRSEIESLTRRSFTTLTNLMEDPDPIVRLRASRTVAAMGMRVADADTSHKNIQATRMDRKDN